MLRASLDKIQKLIFVYISIIFTCHAVAADFSSAPYNQKEINIVKNYLLANISTTEGSFLKNKLGKLMRSKPGSVIASPSYFGPFFSMDYQIHWIRDAAISMAEVVYLYEHAELKMKSQLKPYLDNYVEFERSIQNDALQKRNGNLGEPKYNFDGTLWQGKWARPQNDGPALRAITIIEIANQFLKENNQKYVFNNLLPMIENDLNYISSHWKEISFDLWEELSESHHFFNKMVQRKALIDGSKLFNRLGKSKQAKYFVQIAKQINLSLESHWNANRGYLVETLTQQDIKGGGLNSAIILGLLYGNIHDKNDHFALHNDDILSTIYFIRNTFAHLYPLNIKNQNQPPLIGRYSSDVYDGHTFSYGNPWVLTTNALAQYYYSLANILWRSGTIKITQKNIFFYKQISPDVVTRYETISLSKNSNKFSTIIRNLIETGDSLLLAVKSHSICYRDKSCYHLAEQIDRNSGAQVSAKDLTWGYATLLTAMQARTEVNEVLTKRLKRNIKTN